MYKDAAAAQRTLVIPVLLDLAFEDSKIWEEDSIEGRISKQWGHLRQTVGDE